MATQKELIIFKIPWRRYHKHLLCMPPYHSSNLWGNPLTWLICPTSSSSLQVSLIQTLSGSGLADSFLSSLLRLTAHLPQAISSPSCVLFSSSPSGHISNSIGLTVSDVLLSSWTISSPRTRSPSLSLPLLSLAEPDRHRLFGKAELE